MITSRGSMEMNTRVISSSGRHAVLRYPMIISSIGMRRAPPGPASSISAWRARSTGNVSPIGDAVPIFPPRVAILRICLDPKTRSISARAGTCSAELSNTSWRVEAAPNDMPFCANSMVRSSGIPEMSRIEGIRSCFLVTRSARSVAPHTTSAAGSARLNSNASESVAGRT